MLSQVSLRSWLPLGFKASLVNSPAALSLTLTWKSLLPRRFSRWNSRSAQSRRLFRPETQERGPFGRGLLAYFKGGQSPPLCAASKFLTPSPRPHTNNKIPASNMGEFPELMPSVRLLGAAHWFVAPIRRSAPN